ncbi:MAG: hypothetical protein H7301_02140 [Cryobacterium sp.]|nr:hypothetical protein [Oligoflexia bacterium]
MSATLQSPFLLILSRDGREEFVKNELATRFLGAKFAFSRPGFLSFKQADAVSGGQKNWQWSSSENLIFPLRSALFVGKWLAGKGFTRAATISEDALMEALTPRVKSAAAPIEAGGSGRTIQLRFHAIDVTPVGRDDGLTRTISRHDFDLRYPGCLSDSGLAEHLPDAFAEESWNRPALTGDLILQAFAVSETEVWFGWSLLRDGEFGNPGGESGIEKPEGAPSRAYLKFSEAVALLERKIGKPIFKADDRVIEIGSAPGGACFAMLERGLKVTGVDRGAMDPVVLKNPRFSRIDSSIGDWMFPESILAEWLVLDINAEAKIAVRECKPLTDYIKRGLKGVFFTLKMNQTDLALSTERLARTTAQDLGLAFYFVRQLPSNHQELALFGLTRKGLGLKSVSSR